jgi:cell division septum initiation protein DivIVA
VVAEAKVAANKIRDEAKKQGEALIQEAGSNPLKKKAAELSAKKLNEEAEKKAKKLEDEAQVKSNDIMKKARERADKLG